MQPIVDEHAVMDPDPDERPSSRPARAAAILGAVILIAGGVWALHATASKKVVHCQCRRGEQDQVVSLWQNSESACRALCAKVN
jgi:hypothetical protein